MILTAMFLHNICREDCEDLDLIVSVSSETDGDDSNDSDDDPSMEVHYERDSICVRFAE